MEKKCKNCIYGTIKSEFIEYEDRSIIFLEGEPLKTIYSIQEGYVKVSKFLESGDEFIIGVLGPGDYIALLALLQEKSQYIASASCLSKVKLRMMDKKDVLNAYSSNTAFKENCLKCAVTRSNLFHTQLQLSAEVDVKEKIIMILKNLSYEFGHIENKKYIIKLPFSKTVLANIINIRRETLSRHLSALQKENIIKVEKNTYILNYVI
ncbi:MAG: Crp/Fnr family transcriptional regulator [Tenericutes bacterium]|jgi:CRP-like cAMP-binding protein|nr:Crp/Fnr family transcriptional regulator [Mycoplasmatota bacterium]